MHMAKKILIRILLLLVIIIISNYVYKYTFYKQDVIENGLLNEKLNYIEI